MDRKGETDNSKAKFPNLSGFMDRWRGVEGMVCMSIRQAHMRSSICMSGVHMCLLLTQMERLCTHSPAVRTSEDVYACAHVRARLLFPWSGYEHLMAHYWATAQRLGTLFKVWSMPTATYSTLAVTYFKQYSVALQLYHIMSCLIWVPDLP